MIAMLLIKRLIGLAITVAIIFLGYHYLVHKNTSLPVNQNLPSSAVQGAQNAVQQSQTYQNQINSKAQQYGH